MLGTSHISLSALAEKIREVLIASFHNQDFWVVADVVDHKFYPDSKRHYFGLVERKNEAIVAKIKATAGDEASSAIANFEKITGQRFTTGINVLIKVSVSFHELYGLQVNLNDIDTNYTIGQLARYREQTIERLLVEEPDRIKRINGQLVSDNKKLPLPLVIQSIALISSHSARGYEDFMDAIKKSPRYQLTVDKYYSSVQGENNVQLLVDSLVRIYKSGKRYDVVVIVRGGGSDTDFLIFDHFSIARAVARFPVPVIVGIGHQSNQTICDLVAHTSVNTPSSAAEFIFKHNRIFEDELISLRDRIHLKLTVRVSQEERKLSTLKLSISQSVYPLLHKNRNNYESCRNVLIDHSTRIVALNTKKIQDAYGVIINKPLGIISSEKSRVFEVHSILTQRVSTVMIKKRDELRSIQTLIVNDTKHVLQIKNKDLNDIGVKTTIMPDNMIGKYRSNLDGVTARLKTSVVYNLHKNTASLKTEEALVRVMSPVNILKKGFAIIYSGDKVVTDGSAIQLAENLSIRLKDTKINVTVNDKIEIDGNEFNL